jgi:hypothetical protein
MLRASSIRFCIYHAVLCLVAVAMMASVSAAPAEKVYIVRRGDTLYGIARNNKVSRDQLAERNRLNKNGFVYIGQRLIIPASPSTPVTSPKTQLIPALPSSVQSAIDKADVRAGRWKYIVIHHSGVGEGTAKGMDRYHREARHMENGLAYHFVIGNGHGMDDGEIAVGNRWTKQLDGGHLASVSQNKISLGICLVGNFEKDKPSARQLDSLRALVLVLMDRCQLSPDTVTTHRRIEPNHTLCPGRYFPTKSFLDSLTASGPIPPQTKR